MKFMIHSLQISEMVKNLFTEDPVHGLHIFFNKQLKFFSQAFGCLS